MGNYEDNFTVSEKLGDLLITTTQSGEYEPITVKIGDDIKLVVREQEREKYSPSVDVRAGMFSGSFVADHGEISFAYGFVSVYIQFDDYRTMCELSVKFLRGDDQVKFSRTTTGISVEKN